MSLGEVLHVRIYGLPVAQGRPRARMFHDRSGTARVAMYDPATSRDWKRTVQQQVIDRRPPAPLAEVPLAMDLTFHLPRPQSLPKRITEHTKRPDLDNLVKAIKDALRGVIYHDDAQIVRLMAGKVYSDSPGVEISITHVLPRLPAQTEIVRPVPVEANA